MFRPSGCRVQYWIWEEGVGGGSKEEGRRREEEGERRERGGEGKEEEEG